MKREELIEHCENQIKMCEMWAISRGEEPSGKVYEEHKLILELLKQEPKTGRWLDWTDDRNDYLKCSICGYGEEGEVKFGEYTPYCPMCGSKMESEG